MNPQGPVEPGADRALPSLPARIPDRVRDLSFLVDPTEATQQCVRRLRRRLPRCGLLLLRRRGFPPGRYGVAAMASWAEMALLRGSERFEESGGGLLGALLDGAKPRVLADPPPGGDEVGATSLAGRRSVAAIPLFECGSVPNMVVLTSDQPDAFEACDLEELTWLVNLLARAADAAEELVGLRRAYDKLDQDLGYIAGLQRALLPDAIPEVPGLRIAVRSRPSERSGGDYYDFFPLPDGRWGILLADVSGHGTVTAVLMAITHAIAHLARHFASPGRFLAYLDRQLAARYTMETGAFVAACAIVFDPARRAISYALAGVPSPRLWRDGRVTPLERARAAPLGLLPLSTYKTATKRPRAGDILVLFTDGVPDALGPRGDRFGEDRLDRLIASTCHLDDPADAIDAAVSTFVGDQAGQDDRTLLTLRFE